MLRSTILILFAIAMSAPIAFGGGIDVAEGFEIDQLAGQNPGEPARIDWIRHPDYGNGVAIAFMDNAVLRVFEVNNGGAQAIASLGGFHPDATIRDIRFDPSGVYGNKLFITVFTGDPEGIPNETAIVFVSPGEAEIIQTAGGSGRVALLLDMTDGETGYDAGSYLEDTAVEGGTSLFHADDDFDFTLLGQNVVPPGRLDMDIQGMEFDLTGKYDKYLVMADSDDHDDYAGILLLRPDLSFVQLTAPLSLGQMRYRDMAISPGGPLGAILYVTDQRGERIWQIDGDGEYIAFASGFNQVESITVNDAGTRMWVSDRDGIYRIQESGDPPATIDAECMTVSAGAADNADNSFFNVGQAIIGTSSGASTMMLAGVMYCLTEPEPCETVPPALLHSVGGGPVTSPCSGYIDPRSESSNSVALDLGIDRVTLVFDEEVRNLGSGAGGSLTPAAFSVRQTGGAPPLVDSIAENMVGNRHVVLVRFNRIITLKEWTTIEAAVEDLCGNPIDSFGAGPAGDLGPGTVEPDRIDIGFLPTDIDQNGDVSPFDLLDFRLFVQNGTFPGAACSSDPLLYFDIDRNNAVEPFDLLRFRLLVNGQPPATEEWGLANMNNTQP